MTEALQHSGVVPITMMLAAFGISRSTFYRSEHRHTSGSIRLRARPPIVH